MILISVLMVSVGVSVGVTITTITNISTTNITTTTTTTTTTTGDTTQRQTLIDKFNSKSRCKLFLLATKVRGVIIVVVWCVLMMM